MKTPNLICEIVPGTCTAQMQETECIEAEDVLKYEIQVESFCCCESECLVTPPWKPPSGTTTRRLMSRYYLCQTYHDEGDGGDDDDDFVQVKTDKEAKVEEEKEAEATEEKKDEEKVKFSILSSLPFSASESASCW